MATPEEQLRNVQKHFERVTISLHSASFQRRLFGWMIACFGKEITFDRKERNHRFLEESLETVQSLGCSRTEAHMLVDYVYNRSVGDPEQEIGGAFVTLCALSIAHGFNLEDLGERELARVWCNLEKIRAKQTTKPRNSPLPGWSGT